MRAPVFGTVWVEVKDVVEVRRREGRSGDKSTE